MGPGSGNPNRLLKVIRTIPQPDKCLRNQGKPDKSGGLVKSVQKLSDRPTNIWQCTSVLPVLRNTVAKKNVTQYHQIGRQKCVGTLLKTPRAYGLKKKQPSAAN